MLKQKFIVQFGTNIGLKILTMVAGVFVARYAGPEVVGDLAYGLAYVSVFSFVLGLFGTPHIKLISEGYSFDKCMSTFSRLQLTSIGIYLIMVTGWLIFSKILLKNSFDNETQETVVWLSIIIVIIGKITISVETSFTGQLKMIKANYPKLLRTLLFSVGKIIIAFLGYKAVAIASWNIISSIVLIPIFIKLLKNVKWTEWDPELTKKYVKMAIPLILYMVIGVLMRNADKLFLEYYTNSKVLGYYTAALSIGGIILLLGNSVGQLFFPLFSKYISDGDWKSVNNKIRKFQDFIVVFVLPVVALLSLLAAPIITIVLGDKYENSIIPFSILIYASFAYTIFLPYINVLLGSGNFYKYSFYTFVKFLFFILSMLLFVSSYFLNLKAVGLAYSNLSVVIFEGLLFYMVVRPMGVRFFSRNTIFAIIIITIISLIASFFIPSLGAVHSLYWLIFAFIYIITVYLSLVLLGILNKKTIVMALDMMKIKSLSEYIKSEIK